MGFKKSSVGLCCKDCTQRYLGCHDHCATFLEAKRRETDERNKIREATKIEDEWVKYKSKKGEV